MIEINTPEDIQEYLSSNDKVVVIVYGTGCNPCMLLKQYLQEELVNSFSDVSFLLINGTENRDWAIEQGIRTVPTTIVYDVPNNSRYFINGFIPASKSKYRSDLQEALKCTNLP